jgi:hypothetical protein
MHGFSGKQPSMQNPNSKAYPDTLRCEASTGVFAGASTQIFYKKVVE